ncbi:glycine/betaine ABC transporter [Bacillus manliponensis]|uniref:Glycine/betaine ABC transporter n=1 Tax=Bacillus manliponensis TaxID=574376 RepID=A0A073JSQ3_9BACI|nr:BCCT family transporter [Bacillus manliponensis]KEK17282.1 glycine/betaine ABC transporter [Bacillus manliponensis]
MIKKENSVLYISLLLTTLFIIWGVLPASWIQGYDLQSVTSSINTFILGKFGWFYSLLMTAMLTLAIYLAFSKYGSIRLGKDDEKPKYSYGSWLSMLFGSGMGIGLIFYGISEPISHLHAPIAGEAGTEQSAKLAMQYSFFHWGLFPWALYAMVALTIAYFTFRKRKGGTIGATVTPLFNRSKNSPIGKTVDILAVLATVFGIVPSIGIGAQQIAGGLSYLFPSIDNTISLQLALIGIFTVLYLISARTGLDRGIKYLSNLNFSLAGILLVSFLIFGPTVFIMKYFTSTLGSYIGSLPSMGLNLGAFNEDASSWIENWTIFYWGWWISWSPFVGTFIARVSRGRTIREFIFGVVFVPTLICTLWFSVFGGTAIHMDMFQSLGIADEIAKNGPEIALFAVISQLPFSTLLTIVGLLLITTFFVTSADSATFVVSMQTSNGSLSPKNSLKLVWGLTISAIAAILLQAGGLNALQIAAIIAAFPFSIVIVLMITSLFKELRKEAVATQAKQGSEKMKKAI